MKTENNVLKESALELLKDRWNLAAGTSAVYFLITMGLQSIPRLGSIASIIISGPLAIGLASFNLAIARNEETQFEVLFSQFKVDFGRAVLANLLVCLLYTSDAADE